MRTTTRKLIAITIAVAVAISFVPQLCFPRTGYSQKFARAHWRDTGQPVFGWNRRVTLYTAIRGVWENYTGNHASIVVGTPLVSDD